MIVTHGCASHVGHVRETNEDAHYCGRRVWAVADGMGGHAASEVASGPAIEQVRLLDASPGELDEAAVRDAVAAANAAVLAHTRRHPGTRGMGTTLVGVARVGDADGPRLCVFNVGDSRAYRLAHGHLAQVSVDHSEVEELRALGIITAAEARVHPLRNVVTRCLGLPQAPDADTWLVRPRAGDRLLLCSDGLTGEVSDGAIALVLLTVPDPQEAADALVAAALAAGGQDNVTVVVLDVGGDDAD
nr:serine/threonine-protein phosphatase [Propionibacterium sp.]